MIENSDNGSQQKMQVTVDTPKLIFINNYTLLFSVGVESDMHMSPLQSGHTLCTISFKLETF